MDEIRTLINEYMEKNKYISCLEELYVLFERNNISAEDKTSIMKEIYKYNKKIYALEEKKFQKLDKMENHKHVIVKPEEENSLTPIIKTKKKMEPLRCDISAYMEEIKKFNDIDDLEAILPARDNEQFDNIVDTILVALYKEKVEIINFIHEYQEKGVQVDDYFDNELEDLDFRIETLLDYKNTDNVLESLGSITTSNKIVFLKNKAGEPMIIQSLKGHEEFYDSFLELIESIIEGNFKRLRVFSNNNKIVDMMEVKGFKTRILFSRLKDNIFVIMPGFIKKCDTDFRHRNLLQNVSNTYQLQKDSLMEIIDNKELMEQEEKYLNELITMLKEKNKVIVK